jgi:hypothetical protein
MSEESQGTLMNLAKALMQRVPGGGQGDAGQGDKEDEEGEEGPEMEALRDRIGSLEKQNSDLLKQKEEAEAQAK